MVRRVGVADLASLDGRNPRSESAARAWVDFQTRMWSWICA